MFCFLSTTGSFGEDTQIGTVKPKAMTSPSHVIANESEAHAYPPPLLLGRGRNLWDLFVCQVLLVKNKRQRAIVQRKKIP